MRRSSLRESRTTPDNRRQLSKSADAQPSPIKPRLRPEARTNQPIRRSNQEANRQSARKDSLSSPPTSFQNFGTSESEQSRAHSQSTTETQRVSPTAQGPHLLASGSRSPGGRRPTHTRLVAQE